MNVPIVPPRITVVVPCYEAAGTVRAAVDSVLAQTFEDFELLIIDDGSVREPVPDGLDEDPRTRVVRMRRNGGYARVTDKAVAMARGEWVTFVDADDTVAPTYLERLLEVGEETGADAVFTPMFRVADGRVIGTGPWNPATSVMSSRAALRALLQGDLSGTQHLLLRRPSVPSEPDQIYSDFVFVVRCIAEGGTVACVDEELYLNTVHAASVTGSLRPGAWDLVRLNDAVRPSIERAFDADEAAALLQDHRDLTLTQLLHTAAHETEDSPLRRSVIAWCRRRITLAGILRQLRRGHRAAAASWLLARVAPSLHLRAYHAFDARRRR